VEVTVWRMAAPRGNQCKQPFLQLPQRHQAAQRAGAGQRLPQPEMTPWERNSKATQRVAGPPCKDQGQPGAVRPLDTSAGKWQALSQPVNDIL
jgi:hypothetical protein